MDSVHIRFPARINTSSFEALLRENLRSTREKGVGNVSFDFSRVQWFELFELSLTAVWIDELVSLGKPIKFVYPLCKQTEVESAQKNSDSVKKRSFTCSYLNRWDFDDFLRKRSVEIEGLDQRYPYWPPDPEQESLLPFRFFENQQEFGSFLSNLRDERQFALLFKETASLAVIGSRGIRDTIISEIGQNIYDHAQGGCAFITIGTVNSLADPVSAKTRYNYSSPLERSFLQNLGYSGYVQIIIADGGKGIFQRLRDQYSMDPSVDAAERKKPTEVRVLDYAFEADTTSKQKYEIPFSEDEDPGRGLFWVKNIARRNKGFLSVRSGSSLIAYDFLAGNQALHLRSNQDFPELKRLANLGGTQIKLYFPLNPNLIQRRAILRSSVLRALKSKEEARYKLLAVSKYFDEEKRWTNDSLQRLLADLLRPVRESPHLGVTVLDFAETRWEKDNLYPLLHRLAQQQHEGVVIVGINMAHDSQIFDIASEVLAEKIESNSLKLKPLLVLKQVGFELLGLTQASKELVKHFFADPPIVASGSFTDASIDEFCSRNDHLFIYDRLSRRPILRLNVSEIGHFLSESYKQSIAELALDQSKGVYYKGQFLLPSNSYVDGYFRINTLLTYENITNQVEQVFVYAQAKLGEPIDCVLTISNDIENLGRDIAEQLTRVYARSVKHIHLLDSRNKDLNAGILLTNLRGKSISILTSVVGTGRSLASVIDICQDPSFQIHLVSILSIVDARDVNAAKEQERDFSENEFDHNGRHYQLHSILIHPLRFYLTKPPDWRVHEIRRIDPKSNAPTPEAPQSAMKPLWSPVDGFFFGNLITNARALNMGHFRRRHRHYIHFIDMVRLADHFGPDIAATIKKDVKAICDVSQKGPPRVTHVLYDGQSRGAIICAEYIGSQFQSSPISMQQLREAGPEVLESIKGNDIVIYESAVSSGIHLQRLVDSVSELKPKRIFAYIMIQRRESDAVRFYQKVDSYSGIDLRIRYFVELEIPPYTVWDCPICDRLEELGELWVYCEDKLIREFISGEQEELRAIEIRRDTELKQPGQDETDELVLQAILRRQLGAAKTDHVPRYPLTGIIEKHKSDADNALRTLEVMAKEMSLLRTYSELFYPSFRRHIEEACMSFLENPVDSYLRERSAIIVLRHLASEFASEFFINNFVPILKGVSHSTTLLLYLFVELLLLIMKGAEVGKVAQALALCQQSLEEDDHFVDLSVEDIGLIEHLLNYVRRKLRIQKYREQISVKPWDSIQWLWGAFVEWPGRVHPKLIQDFPKVIGIYSVEKFDDAFKNYSGSGNFSDMVDKVIPLMEPFADCLRPETRNHLTYFLSQGDGTFIGDYEVLDDSLKTLATLRSQGRLDSEQFDKVFFRNSLVNSAIFRLRQYAFQERTSLIRRALINKFADADAAIRKSLSSWEERFAAQEIQLEYIERQCDVFVPEEVLIGVIDGCLQNVIDYAFERNSKLKKVRIAADQQVDELMISISDSGKGITEEDLRLRPTGGIRRSKTLLALYGGTITLVVPNEEQSIEGFITTIQVKLFSKEKVIWSDSLSL